MLPPVWGVVFLSFVFTLLILFAFVINRQEKRGLAHICFFVAASSMLFIAGLFHSHMAENKFIQETAASLRLAAVESPHTVTFMVTGSPAPTDRGIGFKARLLFVEYPGSSTKTGGTVVIRVNDGCMDDVQPGDVMRARVVFRPVSNFNTPGAFDYVGWWKLRGVAVRGYVKSPIEMTRTGCVDSGGLFYVGILLERLRQRAIEAVCAGVHDPDARAVALALLVGEKGLVSKGVRDAFSASGMGHLLAVSGIHMAMAALAAGVLARLFLFCLMDLVFFLPVRKIVVTAGAVTAVCYAAMAGFSPSATRAMVMICFLAVAWLFARPAVYLNALSFAAWCLLLLNPFYLFDISFQFSFVVVFFLIASSGSFQLSFDRLSKTLSGGLLKKAAALAVATVVASLAAMPLSAWYFNHVSIAAVFGNLVAVPLTGFLILPLLLSGMVVSFFLPGAAPLFFHPAGLLIEFLVGLARFMSHIPFAHRWVIPPALPTILLYYLGIFLCLWFAAGRRWAAGSVALVAAVAMLFFHPLRQRDAGGRLAVHFPDVGQGTCQVVEFPDNAVMVMDAGGFRNPAFDTGERIVGPFLRRKGIDRIDLMVVSHPEVDHYGGLVGLLKTFSVKEIWHNVSENEEKGRYRWNRFLDLAKEKGVKIRVWNGDAAFMMHRVRVRLFAGRDCPGAFSVNDRSLVLSISWQGRTLLFTGDIGRRREGCLVKKWGRIAGTSGVDILTVPHHGSRTSSGPPFLKTIRPLYAVITVGERNRLGLPVHDVVRRLKEHGAEVLRTDNNGTVSFEISDGRVSMKTFRF